jgi:hypothetical protein
MTITYYAKDVARWLDQDERRSAFRVPSSAS